MEKWFDRAKQVMREKKVSQEHLAEEMGMSQPGLSAWLRGFREPALHDINKIADLLGISQVWLTHGEGSKYRLDMLPVHAQRLIEQLIEYQTNEQASERIWQALEAVVKATIPLSNLKDDGAYGQHSPSEHRLQSESIHRKFNFNGRKRSSFKKAG
ncbi:Peptidase S24-like protein [Mycoavidus cysteinexigens]|uniref:Peptidase S24-like protein n=1 Tax=Mycoavidus cysteinexigens TaxID=1553431 RepID=A0A2Z6EW84_9BURK|nr:helix-turn-helix transcriptional regulator [Mycoavidus cysteinexigens]BBE09699.1 Peptidase S24-like protein [Mycoavidus cysteinexigens]GAM51565.1 hypothetical protein EBME_0028 [bacterium endosymbiont of Mortierella elongata FMR23-6]GLR01677.1 hypothetical protein GCM10007934_14890 [Mycoavidus cysteinexigens]